MNTYFKYLVTLLIGLLIGWLIFNNSGKSGTKFEEDAIVRSEQMWTCSMHPQIMQPEQGDCPICGMDLIPSASTEDGLTPDQFRMSENAMALANIQTSVVGNVKGDSDNSVTLSGKIAVNKEAIAVQASYFDGRIERLNVNYAGQEIRKGQLLATIYSPELVAAQQELLTAASLKESQPELYQAVRNKLKLWKLSDSQINSIESSGKVRENFPVYATVSGTVSEVMSAEGNYVKQGQPLAKLSNLNTVWAEFDAYENQLSQLKKGQEIKIRTNAYPNRSFDGKITFIDPVLNNSTRTVTIRATLSNTEKLFKPGMFVSGKVETQGKADTDEMILIPSSAVLWTGERSLVYVKASSNEMREVGLGMKKGGEIEVTSGLHAGEEIVTNGTFTVDAAAQLQGKKSMMNRSGGRTMTRHDGHTDMSGDKENDQAEALMKMELPDAFQSEFEGVIPVYLKLKDALVASDSGLSAGYANELFTILNRLDASDLGSVEQSHLKKTKDMLESISKSNDLTRQRADFVILNENMVALASNLSAVENTLYVQLCPMANDNKGAVWLSTEQEIRNPYYGDAMLKCGTVKSVIE